MIQISTSKFLEALVVLCLFLNYSSFAQQASKVIPPSPNVAALGKYGDIPVSTYSGLPNISIPIYNIVSRDISVPISISYHASGIKVAEEASRVGLGWALNAGGVISRTVMGEDDFSQASAFPYHNSVIPELPTGSFNPPTSYIQSGDDLSFTGPQGVNFTISPNYLANSSNSDFEPDQYSYNFLGYSGKFILKRNKEVVLAKQEKIQIKPLDGQANAWEVMTADGFKYIFDQYETYKDPNENVPTYHKSAWYLTKIISPTNQQVTFHYVRVSDVSQYIKPVGFYTERRHIYSLKDPELGTICSSSEIPSPIAQPIAGKEYENVKLDHIEFVNGKIQFNYSSREDLEGDVRINSIEVFEKKPAGNYIISKKFEFTYTYFNGPLDAQFNEERGDFISKRLKLVSLVEKGIKDGIEVEKNPYVFSYFEGDNNTNLPAKTSFARDHWGYYNGKQGRTTLIPEFRFINTTNQGRYYVGLMGNERDTNPAFLKAFSLKQIKYPTQGTTDFEFEAHDFDPELSKIRDNSYFGQDSDFIEEKAKTVSYGPTDDEPKGIPVERELDLSDEYVDVNGNYSMVTLNAAFKVTDPCTTIPGTFDVYFELYDKNNVQMHRTSMFYTPCTAPPDNLSTCVWCDPNNGGSRVFTFKHQYLLAPGKYTWKAFISASATKFDFVTATYTYLSDPTYSEIKYDYAGGLRVSKITSYDSFDENKKNVQKFIYRFKEDRDGDQIEEEYSYGLRMGKPQYVYFEDIEFSKVEGPDGDACRYTNVVRSSDSNIALNGSAGGSVVGYNQVTILYGENGENGKTIFTYENLPDSILNYSSHSFPFGSLVPRRPPSMSSIPYVKNGLLKNQIEYVNKNGIFIPLKEVHNDYFVSTNKEADLHYGIEKRSVNSNINTTFGDYYIYPVTQTHRVHLKRTREKIYNQGQNSTPLPFIETQTEYFYENSAHWQLTKSITKTSNSNKTLITQHFYPADYSTINSGAIALMKGEKHMHAAAIETIESQEVDNVKEVIGATFTNYQIIGTDNTATPEDEQMILPSTIEAVEIASPISSFTNSLNTGTAADGNYRPKQTLAFHSTSGNLTQVQPSNNISTTYLWGYNHMYPVAEIKNASYSQVKTALGLAQTAEINLGAEGLSQTQINLLKTNLPAAMISTFTYDPLKGMTSQVDPAGVKTQFVYDQFGRLQFIKDADDNIIKHFVYHYKQ